MLSVMLVCMAVLCVTAAGVEPANLNVEWSSGKDSWRTARRELGDGNLWDTANACDPRVLRSSAPFTVLFGLSSVWDKVQNRRGAEDGFAARPLEVHVLGAGYPFEGRSDWSLLSARRPAGVPKVRVVLVLGTPFQSDNVPPLHGQPNALLGLDSKITPVAGKWSKNQEEIVCKGKGHWGTADMDKEWSKEDLCRDHGNGLEVVCVEKFYQDVRDTLPKPDFAVLFSPGFPQLGRRSWDPTLIGLLNDRVPLMMSDVIQSKKWGYKLTVPNFGDKNPVLPGGKWDPSKEIGEDWQTWLAMSKYGAYRVKARRGPFPILHYEDGETLAKNGVVQIYMGYKPNRKPTLPVTEAELIKYNNTFNAVNWAQVGSRECPHNELKETFAFPTSRAFDNAVRDMYRRDFANTARSRRASFSEKQVKRLESYGLLGDDPKQKRRHWGLKAWVFVFKTLGCSNY